MFLWDVVHCAAIKEIITISVFSVQNKPESKCLPVATGSEAPSRIKLTLCFCFLLSTQSSICRWFNLFTSTCSHCCVCCSLVVIFKLLFTGFSLSTLSGLLLSKIAPLSFFLVSNFLFLFFWFSFLKLHKGTRTHAQLPRRPVPPPKPRRSKKGVSRCRLRLPTSILYSPLWFASLSVSFTLAFALSVAASHSATRGDF